MTLAHTEQHQAPVMGAFNERDEKVLNYLGLNPDNPADRAAVMVCRAYDLDAVLKHVVVIPRSGVYITRDGLLHIAHRSGQLDGIVVDQEPTLVNGEWVARVSVYRKDMGHPFTFPGRYPVNGSNKQYAPEMALKAAESHALRRAFSVAGLPTLDEQRPEPRYVEPAPAPERMRAMLGTDDSPAAAGVEATGGEPATSPSESPLLNTSGKLAKHMFAVLGEAGITGREERLAKVSEILGRVVGSSSEMTDADAERVIAAFPPGGDADDDYRAAVAAQDAGTGEQ